MNTNAERIEAAATSTLGRLTTDSEPPYHCNVLSPSCDKVFATAQGLRMHVGRAHTRVLDPNIGRTGRPRSSTGEHECPVCQRRFNSRAYMGKHVRDEHNRSITEFETKESLNCPLCERTFTGRAGLSRHLRQSHGVVRGKRRYVRRNQRNGSGTHGCPYCDYTTEQRWTLTRHINAVHPGKTGLVEMRASAQSPETTTVSENKVCFCPRCGEDIQKWRKTQ